MIDKYVLSFLLFIVYPLCPEVFHFHVVQFIHFYFCCLCFWCYVQETLAKFNVRSIWATFKSTCITIICLSTYQPDSGFYHLMSTLDFPLWPTSLWVSMLIFIIMNFCIVGKITVCQWDFQIYYCFFFFLLEQKGIYYIRTFKELVE